MKEGQCLHSVQGRQCVHSVHGKQCVHSVQGGGAMCTQCTRKARCQFNDSMFDIHVIDACGKACYLDGLIIIRFIIYDVATCISTIIFT